MFHKYTVSVLVLWFSGIVIGDVDVEEYDNVHNDRDAVRVSLIPAPTVGAEPEMVESFVGEAEGDSVESNGKSKKSKVKLLSIKGSKKKDLATSTPKENGDEESESKNTKKKKKEKEPKKESKKTSKKDKKIGVCFLDHFHIKIFMSILEIYANKLSKLVVWCACISDRLIR